MPSAARITSRQRPYVMKWPGERKRNKTFIDGINAENGELAAYFL
jgi:hypothetical protein